MKRNLTRLTRQPIRLPFLFVRSDSFSNRYPGQLAIDYAVLV
jgi:hypothetical protein